MAKFWKLLRVLLAIVLGVAAGLYFSNLQKNRAHDLARTFSLLSLDKAADDALDGAESYAVVENGVRIYYVNTAEDIALVRKLLAKCKAVHEEVMSKPVDRRVIAGGFDLGFAGGSLFLLPLPESMEGFLMFDLPEPYNAQLWALLDSLPERAGQ